MCCFSVTFIGFVLTFRSQFIKKKKKKVGCDLSFFLSFDDEPMQNNCLIVLKIKESQLRSSSYLPIIITLESTSMCKFVTKIIMFVFHPF